MESEELTAEEQAAAECLRSNDAAIVMNEEAASILEQLTDNCECGSCRFLRLYLNQVALEEARHETSH